MAGADSIIIPVSGIAIVSGLVALLLAIVGYFISQLIAQVRENTQAIAAIRASSFSTADGQALDARFRAELKDFKQHELRRIDSLEEDIREQQKSIDGMGLRLASAVDKLRDDVMRALNERSELQERLLKALIEAKV